MTPWPRFAASSIETTCASHPPYGRTSWPGIGLFVTVTIVPATATVAVQPQNGSVTFVPETAAAWYLATKVEGSIVSRTGTDSISGFTKIFVGSAAPYPRAGGTTIVFVSPIARPWIPVSNPGTTPPLPIVTGRGAYDPCQANMNAFEYEALSDAIAWMLVSNTSPFSANVPTECTWTEFPL